MFEHEFLITDARALLDRALDHIAGHRCSPRFFHGGEKPRVAFCVWSAGLRRDHDFLHEFADDLAFFEVRHFAFRMEPLSSHRA